MIFKIINYWFALGENLRIFLKLNARHFKPYFPLIIYGSWGYNFSPISHSLVTLNGANPVVVY